MTDAINGSRLSPWARQSPKWGHPWHRMCSYLGTFPPALARSFVAMFSDPGDIVLDPFSGRGTTLLESRLLGRTPLAADLNPIAVALSEAKNASVSLPDILRQIEHLGQRFDQVTYLTEARVQPEDIQLIYNTRTLAELCYLRRRLFEDEDDVSRFLRGALLGIMHGSERRDGTSAYVSIDMPNTFSMSPTYVRKFVERRLARPYRNVFEALRAKCRRLLAEDNVGKNKGVVAWCDVRNLSTHDAFLPYRGQVKLIVTSPPYLDIVNYAKQNWIRNWLMATHENFASESLDDALTLDRWVKFSQVAVQEMQKMLAPDGVIVLVVGDVSRGTRGFISLAREFIQRIVYDNVFGYVGCFDDELRGGVKTTRIWGETKGRATETDRIVVLANRPPSFRTDRLLGAFGDSSSISTADLQGLNAEALAAHAKVFAAAGNTR